MKARWAIRDRIEREEVKNTIWGGTIYHEYKVREKVLQQQREDGVWEDIPTEEV